MQHDQTTEIKGMSRPKVGREEIIRKLVHDLRGPLTSLQLGIETVMDVMPDPEIKPFLDHMLADVQRLAAKLEQASEDAKQRQATKSPGR